MTGVEKGDKRNDDDYIRNTLKTRIREELEYLEEKRKSDLEAKAFFGDEMAQKMADAKDARKEALISGKTCELEGRITIWNYII